MPEAKKLKDSMLHSHKTVKINGILVKMLKSCFKELKKQGYKQIKYTWNGREHTANFDEELDDFNELIEGKWIELP